MDVYCYIVYYRKCKLSPHQISYMFDRVKYGSCGWSMQRDAVRSKLQRECDFTKSFLACFNPDFSPKGTVTKKRGGGNKIFQTLYVSLFIYLFIVTTGYFRVPFCFETFKTSGVLSFFCTHAHTRTHNTVLRHEISTEKPRFPLI